MKHNKEMLHSVCLPALVIILVVTGVLCSPCQAGLTDIPTPAPSWWGTTEGQTASMYADLTDESGSLDWDESLVGENLDLADFTISVEDMVWVDGEGYQSNSPGKLQIILGNYRVLTNKKHLHSKFKITQGTEPIKDIKSILVEAIWAGDGTGDEWEKGGVLGSINYDWSYEGPVGGPFILEIDGWVNPQPWKVRITVETIGGGVGPTIKEIWCGEKCSPVPAPGALALAAIGLSLIHRRRLNDRT